MMENRVEYGRLQTIEDVRRERLRVKLDIERRKYMLENDLERVEEVLTVQYWMDILSVKTAEIVESVTENIASRIRSFSSGFGWLSGWVNKLTRRFQRTRPSVYNRGFGDDCVPASEYYEEGDLYFDPETGEEYIVKEETIYR